MRYSGANVPRSLVLVMAGTLALCLVAVSPPRLVGDGREYLAQAINFASLRGPAVRPADIPYIQSQLSRVDPALAAWDIRGATVADARRNLDFVHFWFYALLATPGLWIANAAGAAPTAAFTALNLALAAAALWLVLPRIGAAAALLLFGSPIVWWIDKAHTEVFTFALLTIVFALLEERPWWAMAAAGAAATQNPPIAALVPLIFIATVVNDHAASTDRRVVAGGAAGLALSALHPLYTYAHHHTPSLLLGATHGGVPGFAMVAAVVLDPTVGLIGNAPVFLLVVATAAIALALRPMRGARRSSTTVAVIAAVLFLLSFARTTNVHHGGTPSLSRYALWLIPLAVPLLAAMRDAATVRWRTFLRLSASASALMSLMAFHPAVPENSREPTWLATLLWTRFPAVDNPLPEVFSETELHADDLWVPSATSGCEKVLVSSGKAGAGEWPVPCYPAALPESCLRASRLCYANLSRTGYAFSPVPRHQAGSGKLRTDVAWPAEAVPHVRRFYESWDWRSLRFDARDLSVLREAVGVFVTPVGSDARFILVLRSVRPDAVVRLMPNGPMRGILVDAMTGRTIASENFDGAAGESWTIAVPTGSDVLLLGLRAEPAGQSR